MQEVRCSAGSKEVQGVRLDTGSEVGYRECSVLLYFGLD